MEAMKKKKTYLVYRDGYKEDRIVLNITTLDNSVIKDLQSFYRDTHQQKVK